MGHSALRNPIYYSDPVASSSNASSNASNNGASSNASSNASNNEYNNDYDVFVNYHGPKVKKTLASHLQCCLSRNGLRVFPYQQELQCCDNFNSEIDMESFPKAAVHIAIFSTNYAESSKHLNELVRMVQSGSTVIPVFYDVKVSDVRWAKEGNGVYAQALRTLQDQKRFDPNTIGQWSEALFDVAAKSGFELDTYNRDEGKMVYKIVKRVLKKLKYHVSYDVFINHRGPDVKHTFASHVYHCLRAHGLRVFLDIEELQKGKTTTPQIERAIQRSSVHVAILSKNYAQSIWCLHELSLMLQSGSPIIPVFYGVEPSDLHSTHGNYSICLNELEQQKTHDYKTGKTVRRHDPSQITKWRSALLDVSKIEGFNLQECNRDEGKLVHLLVQKVLSEIVTQNAAKHPTS